MKVKKLLKIGVGALLYLAGGFRVPQRVPILTYHSIDTTGSEMSVFPGDFEQQMAYLKRKGYKVISLQDFYGRYLGLKTGGQRLVVITFDDGYKNNFEHAFPILRKFDFPASVFVVTSCVGGKPKWLNEVIADLEDFCRHNQAKKESVCSSKERHSFLKSLPQLKLKLEIEALKKIADFPMLDWVEIGEMSKGLISFYSHSSTHPHLIELTDSQVDQELRVSNEILEEKLGKRAEFFCYPYGSHSPRTESLVRAAGFAGACALDEDWDSACEDPFSLKRIPIRKSSFGLLEFKFKLSRAYLRYQELRRTLRFVQARFISVDVVAGQR